MLLLGSSFGKIPVLSLRVGAPIARVVGHLVNPHKLRVDALWCQVGGFNDTELLLPVDIRELSPRGVVVNDRSVIIHASEIIRLEPIITLHFELLGKKVIAGRSTIGKLVDYAVDRDTFNIQKIYVSPKILGSFNTSRLTIDRSQIIEVSESHVRVAEATINSKKAPAFALKRAYSSVAASASLIEE